MPDLKQIIGVTLPVTVKWGEMEINIAFRPAVLTPEWVDSWSELSVDRALFELVSSWDITSDGEPLPVTEEAISSLPPMCRKAMHTAIVGAIFPN